jgi:hypothetical protein
MVVSLLALPIAFLVSSVIPTGNANAGTSMVMYAAATRLTNVVARLQVVTDIDDTIKSSGGLEVGGIFLGGVDTAYTRGATYPGVFQFGLELATGRTGSARTPAPIAVLTARAREFQAALEIKQTDKICVGFRSAGEARGLSGWGVGPVLYGSVAEWICQERKGWRKLHGMY